MEGIRSIIRIGLLAFVGLALACSASPVAPDQTAVGPGAAQLARRAPAGGPDLTARCRYCSFDTFFSNFVGRVQTENVGTGTAPASETRVYLSLDNRLDSGDELLLTVSVPELPPGQMDDYFIGLLPHDRPPRLFYLLTVADAGEIVGESNERNNVAAQKFLLR